jgi:hypothetical protein
MIAFVLNGDFDVVPTHVEHCHEFAVFAVDGDLGLRPSITGLEE